MTDISTDVRPTPSEARQANEVRFGGPCPATHPKPATRGLTRRTVQAVIHMPEGFNTILDFGDVGVVIAGYVSATELDSIRAGRWPSRWRVGKLPDGPSKPEKKAPVKSIRDAVTKRQVDEMLEEAEADERIAMDAPDFLPDYTPVREEAPELAEEAQREAAMERLKREGRMKDLTASATEVVPTGPGADTDILAP